jgi:putative tryptophan/tyrosine transport system substrate-binding protein
MIGRRAFIAGLGSVAAWPVVAHAQQAAMVPVIGYLDAGLFEARREPFAALRRGLSEMGFVEDRNLAIEYRWAENHNDRLPGLAAELVRRRVAAIVTYSTPAALAAKAATTTIPVIFYIGSDPVKFGLVASLNRPGGNVTGVSTLSNSLELKKLEFMKELLPKASTIAMFINPGNPNGASDADSVRAAARRLGVDVLVLDVSASQEIDTAFTALVQKRAAGLIVASDALFTDATDQLVALAARHQVPAIYDKSTFPSAGGLMSYGVPASGGEAFHLVGAYAGRILKGERPANLPVQQVTKLELVINTQTAKALGLTVPETLLATADEVIQ